MSVILFGMRLLGAAAGSDAAQDVSREVHPVAVAANSALACHKALATACGLAGDHSHSLLLIAVGSRSLIVEFAASIGEIITGNVIREQCQTAAWGVARGMLDLVPPNVAARHVICERWRGRELRNCLKGHGCRILVVDGADISTSQQRKLDRLAKAMQLDVVVV